MWDKHKLIPVYVEGEFLVTQTPLLFIDRRKNGKLVVPYFPPS